ncbi:MAG: hypothetical protein QMD85_01430 [Candidatus Aenigmarchaeota archaeon]|nr:hypothetical protein [Candidatus Aenigmarchaeota archaeon]
MPIKSITTTAEDVFFGSDNLDSLNFRNGSATGTIYLRNKQQSQTEVTSTNYEWSLTAGSAIGISKFIDGTGIIGPWRAISDTAGGVTLEILPIYKGASRGR